MKHVFAISFLAIVGTAIGMWAATASSASTANDKFSNDQRAAPRVVLPETCCDLGTVPVSTPLEARFAIYNTGTRRLIVRPVDGSCCGQAEQDSMVIVMPGDSVQLVADIDAGQPGRLEKVLTYTSNDPALPQFELKVSATFTRSSL